MDTNQTSSDFAPAGTLQVVQVGPLGTNCYLLDDGCGGVVVVDPGDEPQAVLAAVGERPLTRVLVTHRHFDHVGAVDALAARCPAGWVLGERDAADLQEHLAAGADSFGVQVRVETAPSTLVRDGDVLELGKLRLRVLECPGHTPGGVSYIDDEHGLAFTGDTLFAGSAGRTDFPGGDARALYASLARLAQLPPQTRVLAGHGHPSTIGAEVAVNPFVQRAVRLG